MLKACSLVCKAWLYPAYRRLFYDTRLSWDQLRIAFDPRSGSNAAPFIRRLHLRYDLKCGWNQIFPFLDGFHYVTSLSIAHLGWDGILPATRLTISNRFIAIVRLELQVVTTTTFSELAQIICTFRCLEKLILGFISCNISDKASPLLCLPPHLHALELDGPNLIDILEWLSSFGQDLTLRNVCFLEFNGYHYQVINKFLRVLGPSLESFRMRLVGALRPSCVCYCLLNVTSNRPQYSRAATSQYAPPFPSHQCCSRNRKCKQACSNPVESPFCAHGRDFSQRSSLSGSQ